MRGIRQRRACLKAACDKRHFLVIGRLLLKARVLEFDLNVDSGINDAHEQKSVTILTCSQQAGAHIAFAMKLQNTVPAALAQC